MRPPQARATRSKPRIRRRFAWACLFWPHMAALWRCEAILHILSMATVAIPPHTSLVVQAPLGPYGAEIGATAETLRSLCPPHPP